MDPDQIRRRAPVLWLFMGLLVVLVCVLAVLQYRWIGEISTNEQKVHQADLQAAANKLSSAFNAELNTAAEALQPSDQQVQEMGRQKAYETRYSAWRTSAMHPLLFRRIAVVDEENSRLALRMFNAETGALEPADWPADWIPARDFFAARAFGRNNGPPRIENSTLIDYPRFRSQPDPGSGRAGEQDWLLLDVDSKYAGEVILPELLPQYFTDEFRSLYRVEIVARARPSELIFGTEPGQAPSGAGNVRRRRHSSTLPALAAAGDQDPMGRAGAWRTIRDAAGGCFWCGCEMVRSKPRWLAPAAGIWRYPRLSFFCFSSPAPRWRNSREEPSSLLR